MIVYIAVLLATAGLALGIVTGAVFEDVPALLGFCGGVVFSVGLFGLNVERR